MRRWMAGIMLLCMAMSTLISCGSSTTISTAADGLNLHAVATLIPRTHDGEHFEHLLNTSSINNLDLDGDGHVDYINIKEYGDGDFRGFSLSTTLHDGSIQQIAEIQFQRQINGIGFQIHGNPQIYGNNYYIRSAQPITVGQAVLVAWLFTPRVVYVSPYNRLYLPPAYVPVRVVPVVEYRRIVKPVVKQVNVQQVQKPVITAPVKSPNEGKSSPVIVAPLANPTHTQKQFQERPETKQIQQATGFAKPKPADLSKPAVQGTQPAQVPGQKTGVAPTISGRTGTDKQFEERREEKQIPSATGFANKPAPAVPAPTPGVIPKDSGASAPAPKPTVTAPQPSPTPTVAPKTSVAPAPAPKESSQSVTRPTPPAPHSPTPTPKASSSQPSSQSSAPSTRR